MIELLHHDNLANRVPFSNWQIAPYTLPTGMAYGNATVYEDDILLHGVASNGSFSPIYRFNGSTFTQLTSIPGALGGMSIAVYGNTLFVFASGDGSSGNPELRRVREFDLLTKTWSLGTAYTLSLIYSPLAVEGRYAYLLSSHLNDSKKLLRFDMVERTFTEFDVPVPILAHMFIGVREGVVYFGGGRNDDGSVSSSSVYQLDTHTSEVTALEPLPEVGYFCRTYALRDNQLYVYGGLSGTSSTAQAVYSRKTHMLNLQTLEWKTIAEVPYLMACSMCCVWNDKLHVFGGRSGTPYNSQCAILQ